MPMTMYEIAFPVTINIGAWAVVYVRQIGQIANSGLGECPAYILLYKFSPKDTGQSKVK